MNRKEYDFKCSKNMTWHDQVRLCNEYIHALEEQNKELQENIGLTMNLSESILQELNSERGIKEYLIKSFKEQIQGLQSLLDLKQQEISVLESKVGEVKTCGTCKYWYEKSCSNNDGIAYNGTNAVYEDDYCKDYEAKQK